MRSRVTTGLSWGRRGVVAAAVGFLVALVAVEATTTTWAGVNVAPTTTTDDAAADASPPPQSLPLPLQRLSRTKRFFQSHPHLRLTTPELIKARGYPAEVHEVITEDGYILEIHRIPHGIHEASGRKYGHSPHDGLNTIHERPPPPYHHHHSYYGGALNGGGGSFQNGEKHFNSTKIPGGDIGRSGRRVVLLFHGILCSSADWVMNDPDQALGFIMADKGYDVWIANVRGNFYGKRHVRLKPEQEEFWNYSWSEIAQYDIPATLRYVMKASGAAQVSYVGHSMGASLLFVSLHFYPNMNTWLHGVASLAPAAYMHNKKGPLRNLAPFIDTLDMQMRQAKRYELLPLRPDRPNLAATLCSAFSLFNPLCTFFHFLIGGPNDNYIDPFYLDVIFAHTPAGTNFRIFTHLMQIVHSKRFQAFDYGANENMLRYGSPTPPRYSLASAQIPVGLFWSDNDWIVDPKDVALTASELPWVALNYRVPLSDFNHLDFMWAENAAELVYKPVLEFLERCEQRGTSHAI